MPKVANIKRKRPSISLAVVLGTTCHLARVKLQVAGPCNASVKLEIQALTTVMAFPAPNHLPWRPVQVDVSSKILTKIDLATNRTINSSLAQEWIGELHQSIQSTEVRVMCQCRAKLTK